MGMDRHTSFTGEVLHSPTSRDIGVYVDEPDPMLILSDVSQRQTRDLFTPSAGIEQDQGEPIPRSMFCICSRADEARVGEQRSYVAISVRVVVLIFHALEVDTLNRIPPCVVVVAHRPG